MASRDVSILSSSEGEALALFKKSFFQRTWEFLKARNLSNSFMEEVVTPAHTETVANLTQRQPVPRTIGAMKEQLQTLLKEQQDNLSIDPVTILTTPPDTTQLQTPTTLITAAPESEAFKEHSIENVTTFLPLEDTDNDYDHYDKFFPDNIHLAMIREDGTYYVLARSLRYNYPEGTHYFNWATFHKVTIADYVKQIGQCFEKTTPYGAGTLTSRIFKFPAMIGFPLRYWWNKGGRDADSGYYLITEVSKPVFKPIKRSKFEALEKEDKANRDKFDSLSLVPPIAPEELNKILEIVLVFRSV